MADVKPPKVGERLGHRVSINKLVNKKTGKPTHKHYKWRATFIEGGKRKHKYFKTKAAADEWSEDREDEARESGTSHRLTHAEKGAVIEARKKLDALGLDVRTALNHSISYFERSQKSATIAELVEQYINEARGADCSDRHISDLNTKLGKFVKVFGDRSAATIEADEIAGWLEGLGLKNSSFNSYRNKVVAAFNVAVTHGYVVDNVAAKVRAKKIKEALYSAITPDEATALLGHADEQILPVIALGLFTGTRTEELRKLKWDAIDFTGDDESLHGYVRIEADIAKSARNRLIPISENLATILAPLAKKSGRVWPENGRKIFEETKVRAGFGTREQAKRVLGKKTKVKLKPWPKNAMRHSYASYHLAHHKDMAPLALNMGHVDTKIIFKHYRQLVKPADAAIYWALGLGDDEKVVQFSG